ncbi:MAG: PEP-CTERM sorting domain-containing protein [Planctomycetes bacterium]|nr:PEP-CTERM sorting domain-containing protein [Planctomycetota bacterium]
MIGLAAGSPAQAALTFNLVPAGGMSAQAIAGFNAAAARWSNVFSDSVTINININFTTLGAGILGSTSSSHVTTNYTNFKNAMNADATSTDDASATASLQSGSSFKMLLNYTSNNPNGSGSATTYLDNDGDANNTTVYMTNANAKALGLLAANNPAVDASIAFSDQFTWDFDPTNGITGGAYDFVGVATHEIGHVLGFISGVDILDTNSTSPNFFADNVFTYVDPLDMFRFSAASIAAGGAGTIDWTAGSASKYFSIDGGATSLTTFSTGQVHGDGRQASHWKDNLGIGIMDPTAAPGELLSISTLDLRAFDVMGWDLASVTVAAIPLPEPAELGVLGLACMLFIRRRWRLY